MNTVRKEEYKKQILMYLTSLLIMLISYLFFISISFQFGFTIVFGGIIICQSLFIKKYNKRELVILYGISLLNYLLYRANIFIRLDIMLAIYFAILTIYYIAKDATRYKWQKVICIALIVPLVMGINFYSRKDNPIKDRALEKVIKNELKGYGNDLKINLTNLEKMWSLRISYRDKVHNLDGIENLKNLEYLDIDNIGIKNFDAIGSLNKLKMLYIAKGKLEDILALDNLEYLENLNLTYVEISDGQSLNKYKKLKTLSIQGAKLKDLSLIEGLDKLQELRLSYSDIEDIKGIESLPNIKKLTLYHTNIKNMDKVKDSKSLNIIYITKGEIEGLEELKKLQKPKIVIQKDIMDRI